MTQAADVVGRFIARLTPGAFKVADELCTVLLATPGGPESSVLIALRAACTLRKVQLASRRRNRG